MKKCLVTLAMAIAFLLGGCAVYQPQLADIPLIHEKDELQVEAGISVLPAAHATISYGLGSSLAVQAFGSYGNDNKYYFQGALGHYVLKGENKVLEFYGGMGYGYGSAYKDANPGDLYGNYLLYFGQLNYGKIATENSKLELGIGLKAGFLHSNLTDQNYYILTADPGPYPVYQENSILLEPAAVMRIGGGKLRLSMSLGSCVIYKLTDTSLPLPYSYINLGIGLNYRF